MVGLCAKPPLSLSFVRFMAQLADLVELESRKASFPLFILLLSTVHRLFCRIYIQNMEEYIAY